MSRFTIADTVDTAGEAAAGAGQLIVERYLGPRAVRLKGFRDLVTDADKASEAFIFERIRARFPEHGILSEESGEVAVGNGYTWVVDPLDGTTNYAHRHPVFCVSISVLEGEQPVVGVIHDPLRHHTFVAQKGAGARLNDEPIRVSRVAALKNALIGIDWGHDNEVRERMLNALSRILPRCGTLRASGSAALALAYVAAGWNDAYFQPGLKPWDTAAGVLLINEAGGRSTTIKGEPYRPRFPDCVASNGSIHDDLLKLLGGLNFKRIVAYEDGSTE